MRSLHTLPWLTVVSALAACGSPSTNCVPGEQLACGCPDGTDRIQVCNADGSALGACDCDAGNPQGDDTDVADTDVADTDVVDTVDTDDAIEDTDVAGCTELTLGELMLSSNSAPDQMRWQAPVLTDLGNSGDGYLSFEFYSGIEPSLAGTFDLTQGAQANYISCAACLMLTSVRASDGLARMWFQASGTFTLDQDPLLAQQLSGRLANVHLEEVTLDAGDSHSTPVPGGKCLTITALELAANGAPVDWRCSPDAYTDGMTCDCECGVVDPDCVDTTLQIIGCSSGDTCDAGLCETPIPNEQCATAQVLTLDTPIAGTSAKGVNDYDAGLEAPWCLAFDHVGPDVAYVMTLARNQSISVTATPTDAWFDLGLAIVGPGGPEVCDVDPVVCLLGVDEMPAGYGETLDFTAPAPGTYYILVDTYGDGGDFSLEVTSP